MFLIINGLFFINFLINVTCSDSSSSSDISIFDDPDFKKQMKKLLEQYKKREERKKVTKVSKSKKPESTGNLYDALELYKDQKDDSELSEETQLIHNREQLIKDLEKVRETEKHKEKEFNMQIKIEESQKLIIDCNPPLDQRADLLKNYFRETLPAIEGEDEPMEVDSEYLREIMDNSIKEKENKKLEKEKRKSSCTVSAIPLKYKKIDGDDKYSKAKCHENKKDEEKASSSGQKAHKSDTDENSNESNKSGTSTKTQSSGAGSMIETLEEQEKNDFFYPDETAENTESNKESEEEELSSIEN
ncbi:hypothetical protein EHP00_1783 [Ecytonucleospora hepatopenaei]|uniref:Uncharacterized protein n=1 Tax=Ecytonucleospora hepatopenaei TaxID=646526 RepID=A0A1W0E2Z4_9MICR|nr:hypothetical protein EHP00_1783 [Ecytonucleospora hepatopenaei]